MVKQSETIHIAFKTCQMLFWQYGTIPDPLTQTQTTTFALKEKLVGVGIREIWPQILKNTHSHPLPKAVSDSILPVFTDLSKSQLLSSCLHGGAQNQSEAFNALIWQRATKETHSNLPTVELATFLAVGIFNNGAKAILAELENRGARPRSV